MYAKLSNGQIEKYPYSLMDLYEDNPSVGFPSDLTDEILARFNAARVIVTGQPDYDRMTQAVSETNPVYSIERQRWEQTWEIVSLTPEQIAANHQALQDRIVAATQVRLDTFAQTRGYDSILSACTYTTSSITKFQFEAQYCVRARDETWATLHQIMAEITSGKRPIPTGYEDIEADLPMLAWPV